MALQRYLVNASLSITASSSTSPVINYGSSSGGMVYLPSGSSLTGLQVYVCATVDGTYVALYDSGGGSGLPVYVGGNGATLAASRAYPLPDECFGAAFIRPVGNTTGTVTISLKG